MTIKVYFKEGATVATVSGLHQWDYGQVLEIEASELGSEVVEVHFAHMGLPKAIVCPCSIADGIAQVRIPDICLEQASQVTAWIYEIGEREGHTVKTIILPITERMRPSRDEHIPEDVSDTYTQLIASVNDAISAIENGTVSVDKAKNADLAKKALIADAAKQADTATTATSATTASRASVASKVSYDTLFDGGDPATCTPETLGEVPVTKAGLYLVSFMDEWGNPCVTTLPVTSLTTTVRGEKLDDKGRRLFYNGDGKFLVIDTMPYIVGLGTSLGIYKVLCIPF